ncbi:hypothetical protein J4G33_04840 [Actinotalea sp. BY-33]|uniref:Peptidase S9 n=1 Tax=Actinotalea soli TaxID=2819234 RepID=A0A939LR62_9CELL|nr:hypothetical protein [Actinotalea soli]MBO1751125.1 hypothetical protein [Actinotalea soli]
MTTTPTPARVLAALSAGVATTAFYATPDVFASRAARVWAKAGIGAVLLASSAPEVVAARETWREKRASAAEAAEQLATVAVEPGDLPDNRLDDPVVPVDLTEAWQGMNTRGKAVVAGVTVGAVASSVALMVLGERWVFRRGESRAAAGKTLPHTGPALLYGVLAAGVALLPDPTEDASGSAA